MIVTSNSVATWITAVHNIAFSLNETKGYYGSMTSASEMRLLLFATRLLPSPEFNGIAS